MFALFGGCGRHGGVIMLRIVELIYELEKVKVLNDVGEEEK